MVGRLRRAVAATSLVALSSLLLGMTPATAAPVPVSANADHVTQPLAAAKPFTSKVPTIKGSAAVGQVLTAVPGAWSPAPTKFTYQWYRSGVAIAKATGVKYTLVAADLGKKITVRVTAQKPGYKTTSQLSKPTAAVAAGAFSAAPAPKIAGTATVGNTLTAQPGTWKPKPAKITYQWYRSGKPIAKAIGAKYALVAADAGHAITVRVTASSAGYKTTAKTSAATAKVAKAAPPVNLKPPAEVYYANCAAARAAGAAPIRRGQPGYRPALDRDDDGIACE